MLDRGRCRRAVGPGGVARVSTPLTPRLATLTRDQLVALVERLIARHPDLADLAQLVSTQRSPSSASAGIA